MKKANLCVVGAGWRAEYFLRVARAHADEFEVGCVLCRSEEKADHIAKEFGVMTTMDETDIIGANPDFIVVAVSRSAACGIALKWKRRGFTVLMETPMGDTVEEILQIKEEKEKDGKLLVAEQYRFYPSYEKIIDAVKSGLIGEPICANASVCHDYHGFDVIRQLLDEPVGASFKMRTEKYDFPVTKTGDRFNIYTDGELITKTRSKVDIVYEDGKVGFYDFDSDQYHSTIRHNTLKVTGIRGEIIDGVCYYLDENNVQQKMILVENFQFAREEKADDENAVYRLMQIAFEVSQLEKIGDKNKRAEILDIWNDNFDCGLMDAYMTVLMKNQGNWMEVKELC